MTLIGGVAVDIVEIALGRKRGIDRVAQFLSKVKSEDGTTAETVDLSTAFELMDYRDVTGTFDRITSVGLIEHLGTPHYPGFFSHTNRLLKAVRLINASVLSPEPEVD